MYEDDDPDDPARHDEVARRLMAYAAQLRAEGENGERGAEEEPECE